MRDSNDLRPNDACLRDEDLAALAEGRLDASARENAERHLSNCAACRRAVVDVTRVVAEQAKVEPPAELADRILAATPETASPTRGGTMLSLRSWTGWAAIAAVLLVGIGVIAGFGQQDEESSRADDGAVRPAPRVADLPEATPANADEVVVPPRLPNPGGHVEGMERYLAHVSTDKSLYKPGERMLARAVLLNAFDRRPFATETTATFEVKSARGELIHTELCRIADGVAGFGWDIPSDQTGGQFELSVMALNGAPPAKAEFDIRAYRAPRLRTDLQFLRKAYGPGDEVVATLEASRAEGGIPAGAKAVAVARVDGVEVHREEVTLDAEGRCRVDFTLPAKIEVGAGTLALAILDGGVQETAAKTIPIVVNKLAIEFFPEGGELVAGLDCGVYLSARTPKQEPADVKGRIIDESGNDVATFETAHEGRGRFTFEPKEGASYLAVVDHPAGITDPFPLPSVASSGFVLTAQHDVTDAGASVVIGVQSSVSTAATVGLFLRERELDIKPVRLSANEAVAVRLDPQERADGVLRVTLYDAEGEPRAERLVFRRPDRALNVELTPDADKTVPGGRVRVNVRTTDHLGRPVAAVVGVAATDDAVLSKIDPRERAPRLDAQALLGAEVSELRDPQAYLDGSADGARNVDLLLATQGWRRFCYQDPAAFLKAEEDRARTVLAHHNPSAEKLLELLKDQEVWDMAAEGEEAGGEPPVGAPMPGAAERPDEGDRGAADPAAGPVLPQGPPQAPGLREPAEPEPRAPPVADPAPPALEPMPQPAAKPRPRGDGDEDDDIAADFEAPELLEREVAHKRLLRLRRRDEPAWFRLYAHRAPQDRPTGERRDFTETVYWNAALATDDQGRATFEFDASDSITTLRVRADGVTKDGALGVVDATVEVRRPFYVEPKFPLEVTAGDHVDLPLMFVNGTSEPMKVTYSVSGEAEGLDGALFVKVAGDASVQVAADSSARLILPIDVGTTSGDAVLLIEAAAGPYTDTVERNIKVVPAGFPIQESFGGVLERIVEHEIELPDDIADGSLTTEVTVYPSPLASLTEALAALLREPYGCFEQTSSSNYPNVMALQYMASHEGVDPALVKRARTLLDKGYKKLVSFECKQKGYEWFGGDPGHEALTAYGVLEFADMSQVMDVDQAMVERTRKWLLSRRDGKGGFERNSRALDSFGSAPQDITDAYILWALTETGQDDLDKEIAKLRERASASKDAYLLALAANVFWNTGDRETAHGVMKKLSELQDETGVVNGAATSITRSGGESLQIEATSLTILAWLRTDKHTREIESAMRWLSGRCKAGRFGSTQATILALKAITAYDSQRARPKVPGVVHLVVDGASVHEVPFPAGAEEPIVIPSFAFKLAPGPHTVQLRMEGGADMPYSMTVRYNATTPVSAAGSPLSIETSVAQARVAEGEPVEVPVVVRNDTSEGIPMAVAIVGIPGGLEVRAEQLKELVKEGLVDAIETRGREVILYWRAMAPDAKHALNLSCIAAVPGTYEGPASRTYLYYTDEEKVWVEGLQVEVTAK